MTPPKDYQDRSTAARNGDKYMTLERHLGTIMGAIIIAILIWVGSSLTTNIDASARTDERLKNIEADIGELKSELGAKMGDRFTGSQATAMRDRLERRLRLLEQWRSDVEKRLDRIEMSRQQKSYLLVQYD